MSLRLGEVAGEAAQEGDVLWPVVLAVPGLILVFDVEATVYASDTEHYAARLKRSYDRLITDRLTLQPEAEMNFYTKSAPGRRMASGLSDIDAGLRLRCELSRKLASYVGVSSIIAAAAPLEAGEDA